MNDTLVLCYHAAGPRWPAPMSIHPDRFERQLRSLLDRGYRGERFTDAVQGGPHAGRVVAVTFDDAYRSIFDYARPVLDRLRIPATVFVPTAFADRGRPMSWPGISHWAAGPHADELKPMSWAELRELAAGGWEIGSHTRTHPRLPELDDRHLRGELEGSRADCEERVGARCTSIAYPYGDANRRVAAAAKAAGYAAGGVMSRRLTLHDPWLWPRVGIYRDDDDLRFALKTSPSIRRARIGAVFGVRRSLRRARR